MSITIALLLALVAGFAYFSRRFLEIGILKDLLSSDQLSG